MPDSFFPSSARLRSTLPVHRVRRVLQAVLVLLCVLLISARDGRAQGVAVVESSLVVPFEITTPTARTYWLGEGVAVSIGDELERLGIRVLSREARVRALDELRLPTSVALTRATYLRIGELLGAGSAVFGKVTTDGTTLTVNARRVQLESGQLGAEVIEQGNLFDLFTVCRKVARRLLTRDPGSSEPPASPPLDAFEAYIKALLADRPEARVRLLDTALARAPGYDRIRLALWDAQMDLGEHAKALAAVQTVPESSPLLRTARFDASLSLIELKRYDEAFTTLRALADTRPEAAILNNLGVVQIRHGSTPQTGRATYFFNKAAELEPDDSDLFFNLGYAYWEERDAKAAIFWLREALRRNPADADAHFVLAAALDAAGTSLEAGRERALAQHLSTKYTEPQKRGSIDGVPRGLERVKESLSPLHRMRFDAALTQAAQRNQQDVAEFHLERARRYFEERRDSDAEPELRRVLFLSPYHAEAHLLVGRVYLRSGRLPDAIAAFRISIWSSETADAQLALGGALLDARDQVGARAAAQRAMALDPDNLDARALLAHIDAVPK